MKRQKVPNKGLALLTLLVFLATMTLAPVNPGVAAANTTSGSGSVIVRFQPGVEVFLQEALVSKYGGIVLERNSALNFTVVTVDKPADFIDQVTKETAVEYAELNAPVWAVEPTPYVPNDPEYFQQWGITKIKADLAWDIEKGSKDITIAIVDTGIDYNHEDLGNYISGGYDWVNDDANPWDDEGHGTHCAGIAAATMDNSTGVAGIAQVNLIAEKVLDRDGEGTASDVASGIQHAADLGADIISLSLGQSYQSLAVQNACDYAWDQGCVIVAAAGNDNERGILYPAAYYTVISVGAIDQDSQRCSYSSWGSNWGSQMELVAPGRQVLSTTPGNNYSKWDGTSMATPHVAGAAALVWSRNPELTNQEVRDLLIQTADDLGAAGWDEYYGYGAVDAEEAVYTALPPPPTPPNQPLKLPSGETIQPASNDAWSKGVSLEMFNIFDIHHYSFRIESRNHS